MLENIEKSFCGTKMERPAFLPEVVKKVKFDPDASPVQSSDDPFNKAVHALKELMASEVGGVNSHDEAGVRHNWSRNVAMLAVLMARKQRDYGSGNIALTGEKGVVIRLNDKVQRLLNLARTGESAFNESVRDTWQDIANYGLIGLDCHDGSWPGVSQAWRI